jgi:predicted Zn-dependent protease
MKKNHYCGNAQKGGTDIALFIAVAVLFASIGGSFIYFSLFGNPSVSEEKTLQKTIEAALLVPSYSAEVTIEPEGNASSSSAIKGTMFFDVASGEKNGSFSFPLFPGKATPNVEMETVFFSDEAYAKMRLNDPKGESIVKFPEDWVRIAASENGLEQFEILRESLASADTLELFRKGGRYLVIDGEVEKQLGGKGAEFYFALRASQVESLHPSGVSKNFDTLLKEGGVHVRVDSKNKNISEVRFSVNGYLVTMKIKDVGKAVAVVKPEVSLALKDWKIKQFSQFAPAVKVSEIFIGSYGAVKKEYLEAIRSAIEKATGIKPVVLLSGSALPERPPLYNAARKQFDSVPIFESIKSASAKYGEKTHFIYVLDADLYSSDTKSDDSVWHAGKLGINAALMSLSGLFKTSDTDKTSANQALVIARAQKIALHVLGTSVGFSLSPSTEIPECLMRETSSLSELDKEGSGYCSAENAVIKNFFGK